MKKPLLFSVLLLTSNGASRSEETKPLEWPLYTVFEVALPESVTTAELAAKVLTLTNVYCVNDITAAESFIKLTVECADTMFAHLLLYYLPGESEHERVSFQAVAHQVNWMINDFNGVPVNQQGVPLWRKKLTWLSYADSHFAITYGDSTIILALPVVIHYLETRFHHH